MSSCTRPCRKGKFTAQPAEAVEDRAIQKEKKKKKSTAVVLEISLIKKKDKRKIQKRQTGGERESTIVALEMSLIEKKEKSKIQEREREYNCSSRDESNKEKRQT